MKDQHPKPSHDNMREAERLARKLELSWNADRPPSNEHVQRMYALNVPILAAALQAKDEKFDAMITTRDDALLDAEAALHASRAAPVNAMREALKSAYGCLCYVQHNKDLNRDLIQKQIDETKAALSSAPAVEPVWVSQEIDLTAEIREVREALRHLGNLERKAMGRPDAYFYPLAKKVFDRILKNITAPAIEQESAWRDVRRAALEEAATHCQFEQNDCCYEVPDEGLQSRCADAIRALIDTPPKPEVAEEVGDINAADPKKPQSHQPHCRASQGAVCSCVDNGTMIEEDFT